MGRKKMKSHIADDCSMTMIECANCNESMKRKHKQYHLKNVCSEALIECTFRRFGCMEKLKRKDLDDHIDDECDYCPMTCHLCEESGIIRAIMEHHIDEKCPMTDIDCKQCKQTISRGNKANHLKNECRETLIECTFKQFGCLKKMKRKYEKKHVEENAFAHMSMMAKHQKKLEKKVKKLQIQNQEFIERDDALSETIKNIKSKIPLETINKAWHYC